MALDGLGLGAPTSHAPLKVQNLSDKTGGRGL